MLFTHLFIVCHGVISTYIQATVSPFGATQAVSEDFLIYRHNAGNTLGVPNIFQTLTPLILSINLQSKYADHYCQLSDEESEAPIR